MQRKQNKFRSNFEVDLSNKLSEMEQPWSYEQHQFKYVSNHTYTPDFCIAPDIFIEGKGLFDSADRRKMLEVTKQHPNQVFIMCFQNPNLKIQKNSKTRYRDWSDKHGFIWCESNERSIKEAIQKAYRKRWEFGE